MKGEEREARLSAEEYVSNPLWMLLVETVHSMVMYPHHKYYVQSVLLSERPDASPQDVSVSLGISLGEAMVILHELKAEKKREGQ